MTNATMTKSGLPNSTRKFIRLEKARIRGQFFDIKKQEEMINELYKRLLEKPTAEPRVAEKKEESKKVEAKKETKLKPKKVGVKK